MNVTAKELEAVLDSVYNGVIAVNEQGIVTWYNAAAEKIMGIPAKMVIGYSVGEVIPNTGLPRVISTRIAEVNKQQCICGKMVLANRTPVIKDGECIGAVGVFQDITEFKAVADELEHVKDLKSTLESILESALSYIVVADKDGKITRMSQAYVEFLGLSSQQDVIGKHVTEVIDNTRMHIVSRTGRAEVKDIQKIRDKNCVVSRVPIVKEGKIVGSVGHVDFKDIMDLEMLARRVRNLQSELEYYKEELLKTQVGKYTIEDIIGAGEKINYLKKLAARAAKGNSTVLILGESGTGKEVFSHAIHSASPHRKGPFIKLNCAAIPENLLESELFGYDEGAFSGAKKGGKPGKFELANGGTIFLDEIGDMPLPMQAKLLRVLQEKEIERVGGTKTIKINVRVIAATNRDIETMVEQEKFRKDLYYRLNIITLQIPALREHKEDIPLLCVMLLRKIDKHTPHNVKGVSQEAMDYLTGYGWPGNIRELENVLERAVNLMDDENSYIMPEHLPPIIKKYKKETAPVLTTQDQAFSGLDLNNPAKKDKGLEDIRNDAERAAMCRALVLANGNKSRAAKLLGIHRSVFYEKLKKYKINADKLQISFDMPEDRRY